MLGNDLRNRAFLLAAVAVVLLPAVASGQIFYVPTETPEQGKAFSEFNHRLAGIFLLGIGIVAAGAQLPKLGWLAKLWPFFFVLPGLYLAAMSDPEVWPMGHQSWLEAFRTNPEGRQHKVFALLLVALGSLELARAAGKLWRPLATWGFPALAVFGATLLFFHPHNVDDPSHAAAPARPAESAGHDIAAHAGHGASGQDSAGKGAGGDAGHDMAGHAHGAAAQRSAHPGQGAAPEPAAHGAAAQTAQAAASKQEPAAGGHEGHVMTETMIKVEKQHFWFSLVGFGIALFKFLYDGKYWRRPFVPYLWPSFMSILGVLLIFYAE